MLTINRFNYEEFFLLYADNELNAAEKKAVDEFIAQNPDLGEELDLLLQSRFTPDEKISFFDKASLYRGENKVNPAVYEEKLILYTDNELDAAERKALEEAVSTNPALQKELELYLQTRSEADTTITFPDKSLLYRREKAPRVIVMRWTRLAVAAVFIMAMLTTGIVYFTRTGPAATSDPGNVAINNPANSLPAATNENSGTQNDPVNVKTEENRSTATPNSTNSALYAAGTDKGRKTAENQNLPADALEPESDLTDNAIAQNDIINTVYTRPESTPLNTIETENDGLNPPSQINNYTGVTLQPVYTYYNPEDDGNNKARGLFRKVTRLIERRTDIDPTTDDNKLLIGSFAISLK